MLKCATSLWSADLANLAADIQRVAPYSERFHLDVADGHYCADDAVFSQIWWRHCGRIRIGPLKCT